VESEFITREFSNSLEKNLLEQIFILNQENTPEVGNLGSIDNLKNLLKMSYKNFYVMDAGQIIAFVVCFKEGSLYKSKNYEFFCKQEESFVYIDRIAIKKNYRRKKLGNNLYKIIQGLASEEKSPLCCEVNTFPINRPSIDFHHDFGFIEIGRQRFEENSVAYFKKELL
tara:strand:+ start:6256 stop:6762 length:507 start_codon:yes stop_codon:yes gene_type:complete